jgi:LPS-assembly protein
LLIEAKNISIDKNKEVTVFKNQVLVKTDKNHTIESELAEYDKIKGIIKFNENVKLTDDKNNIITTSAAEYDENKKIFKTIGLTNIITSENYKVEGENIILKKEINTVLSEKNTIIKDNEGNSIYLNNFEFNKDNQIFKSIGLIKIEDKFKNSYEFSQIYIDTEKKEILGSDVSTYLNNNQFKVDEKNDPRIMANTFQGKKDRKIFKKSIFTLCGYRKNNDGEKCPPWTIQASQMLHDNKKKTIYYDNALIKVYNIPIFYIPKLSHPDPTVKRRSGFLPPTLNNTKNLGSGITVPYYLALNKDKDFTFTNKLFADENPLFMGEYRQAFSNSDIIINMGYTEGYKNTTSKKVSGDKSHLFTKFTKNFIGDKNSETNLSIQTQSVSNDKYLELYKIESNLVDYNQNYLENSLNFSHSSDDYFLSIDASIFENLKGSYNDKYEYIFPEILFDKNLYQSQTLGILDLQSNLKVNNYDTNKTSKLLINDFNWKSKYYDFKNGLRNSFLGKVKNVNYENKNILEFKEQTINEVHGAIGYLSELELIKNTRNSKNLLTPKLFLRYAPGNMRKESEGTRLTPENSFSMDRSYQAYNLEKGLSATVGFDYELTKEDKNFQISVGQIVTDKKNDKISPSTSLNDKISDLVGTSNLKINDSLSLKYNFSLDNNYEDLNYNEVETALNFNNLEFNLGYLQEKKHLGNNEYLKTSLKYKTGRNQELLIQNKRNLIRDASEYYNLSYEYYNDCLRAALVFRREFYNDSELEPENSLMFKITLVPFGSIISPTFDQ